MSVVGSFPGFSAVNRRTIRAPINEMDKCTIVSIYNKRIHERKPTIEPGVFTIEPGSYENPSLLVVGSSSWWKEIDDQQPLLEIPNGSVQVADSIVKDYCNGLLGCNMSDCMPGIFWLPGVVNLVTLKSKHKPELDRAKLKQENFYKQLVKLTDTLWARTNGNPLVISDDARIAAKMLQLDSNKPWMKDFLTLGQENCPACGVLRNPNFPICSNCKAVLDPVKAKELNISFAQ